MAIKITLACAGGFSTSMLVTQMCAAAKELGVEADILAVAEAELETRSDSDIVMLGPQISHIQEELQERYSMPVVTINSLDYGMMNGKKVLSDALDIINQK